MNVSALSPPGGTWTPGDCDITRFGYGAMQLIGPSAMEQPADHDAAINVLREVASLGSTHVDTSDAYGPHEVNRLIREALHPYADTLTLVTMVGATRDSCGGWPAARRPEELRRDVDDNLNNLGVEVLDVLNPRMGDAYDPNSESLADAFESLVDMQVQGMIRHLGLSNVTTEQIAEARPIAPIVCVQNMYNIAHRADDDLIDALAKDGIAYVPFSPLGGFNPLQSETLSDVAAQRDATLIAVALA